MKTSELKFNKAVINLFRNILSILKIMIVEIQEMAKDHGELTEK